jgi:four helix bundle protein
MSRDYRKLRVFEIADGLVLRIYRVTNDFPKSERYGIQSQLRRSALSIPTNIVEGSARRSTREYVNFLNIAAGAAAETRYLTQVSERLGFLSPTDGAELSSAYTSVCAKLESLIQALSPKP